MPSSIVKPEVPEGYVQPERIVPPMNTTQNSTEIIPAQMDAVSIYKTDHSSINIFSNEPVYQVHAYDVLGRSLPFSVECHNSKSLVATLADNSNEIVIIIVVLENNEVESRKILM